MAKIEADPQTHDMRLHGSADTDQGILARFQRSRDEDAFKALVERHHGMVFSVAKRMLSCPYAAEDVVQATFLVLAKDARKIRSRGSLASWLYGIAYRISARSAQQRARAKVLPLKDEVIVNADPLEEICAQSEQNAVLEELYRLPEKTRTPMVLRYLQEQSNAEVAETMSLSESAVEGRLKRGRHQLRMRLARQGVAFAVVLSLLDSLRQDASATEIPQLVSKTVEACLTGTGTGVGSLRGEPFQLAQQEMVKMVTTKIMNSLLVAGIALGAVTVGWGLTGNSNLFAQGDDPFGDGFGDETVTAVKTAESESDPFGTAPPSRNTKNNFKAVKTPTPDDDPLVDFENDTVASKRTPKKTVSQRLRALGEYGIADDSEAYVRIMEALNEPTRIEASDEPIAQVLAVISERHNIPILFNTLACSDENIDPSSDPVSINVSDIKLHNALTLMLDELQLTTVFRNEVLVVTSQAKAEEEMTTRTYRISGNWKVSAAELSEMVTTMAFPDSWSSVGGPGAIQSIEGGLVVSNAQAVHRKISKILAQLDKLYSGEAASDGGFGSS